MEPLKKPLGTCKAEAFKEVHTMPLQLGMILLFNLCFLGILAYGLSLGHHNHMLLLGTYGAFISLCLGYCLFIYYKRLRTLETSLEKPASFLHTINLEDLYHSAPAGDILVSAQGIILDYNKTFGKKFLNTHSNYRNQSFFQLISEEDRDAVKRALSRVSQKDSIETVEFRFHWGAEGVAYIGLFDQSHTEHFYFIQVFDNAQQKSMQLRLVQSQKTQAMGQLAGGIAHDFNNLLTAMIGFCDLLLLRHSPGDQSFTDIMQIKQNANRAANLVRQLLAFSRQQTLQPRVIDVTESLAELSVLLQRLIGVSISLKLYHGKDLGLVRVDHGQFEQVIINLVVNARDAIEESGEILIKTENITLSQGVVLEHDTIPPGSYVLIEVHDNGSGIAPENRDRIFDPFFSTKEIGSGTGLGLATVQGIVTQTGGHITVESEMHKGTKFGIYLPRFEGASEEPSQNFDRLPNPKDLTGTGSLLIVEDEDAVRIFSARALRDKGYDVVEASNGEEGLRALKHMIENNIPPQLLITDVVMPIMDGPTLAHQALSLLPELKIIFMSGYAENAFRKKIHQDEEINFIPKPFSLKAMAQKVKDVLEKDPQKEILQTPELAQHS
jgi:two-component system cell cycle sensor histidine kinase/response regulator CckA